MATVNDIADYIWKRSSTYNVNPALALGIARYEGLNPNTIGSKTFGNPDAKGYSFGPFQLYSGSSDPSKIAPGGMAYEFQQKFGQAPSRDNWQQQVDFALETMSNRGTSPWYAVRDRGGEGRITELGSKFARQLGFDGQSPTAGESLSQTGQNALYLFSGGLLGEKPLSPTQASKTDSPTSGGELKQFGALGNLGNMLMAAGAPKQTWQHGPAPKAVRGQWRDDIFAGLLG